MGFVDPQTVNNPTAGQPATAAWGDAVRDAAVYLGTGKPHARVYNTATQTLTTATNTVVTFDSERYDVGSCHSTSSNTSRLTVPSGEGGVYTIGASIGFAANATGERIVDILLNGTTIIARIRHPAGAASQIDMTITTEYTLAAGDYVEVQLYQNSGGNLNTVAGGDYSPEFWWRWVST